MNVRELFPENILQVKPYVAGKTIEEVKDLYNPDRIAKLASNENRLGCSKLVKNFVIEALSDVQNYPSPSAKKLKSAIAERNNLSKEEVIVAAGSESILSILCRTCFKNDENAVTADATFVGFFVQAGVRGIDVKKVPITDNYRYDVERILDAIDNKTKMVYIANPNNPTGTYLPSPDFEKLVQEVPGDVILVVDEAYYEYAKDVVDYPSALDFRRENMVILRTFSKAYGLAGLRIGYGIADEDIIVQMMKTKLTFEPTALAQAAALAAYSDEDFIHKTTELVKQGRERLYKFFDKHNVNYCTSAANSVMMILDNEEEASAFTQKMLENGVILRQVGAFGLPNCVRITIGTEKDMDQFEEVFEKIS